MIAKNFVEFFLKLEVDNDVEESDEKERKVEVKATAKLLEMLRSSGYRPGGNISK